MTFNSKMAAMEKDAIRKSFKDMIDRAERAVACAVLRGTRGMYVDLARVEGEVARLTEARDKALANVDAREASQAGRESARRARDAFIVACIEEGIDDFTAQVA